MPTLEKNMEERGLDMDVGKLVWYSCRYQYAALESVYKCMRECVYENMATAMMPPMAAGGAVPAVH